MPDYYCECCEFRSSLKSNFERHLKTKKHLERNKKEQKGNKKEQNGYKKEQFLYPKKNKKNINMIKVVVCQYCDKEFSTVKSKNRHIKYTCKKNKDEDMKELVRLLNEQNLMKEKDMKEMQTQMANIERLNEKLQKQIDKLTSKLQIQHIHNTNSNNNTINYNIKLLNYNQTDYTHLTEQDYVNCIQDCNYCVKSLIEKVHFNEEKPENKNIYISNIKNKYIMLYKNNKWQLVDRKSQLDDLYDYNEVLLENWYAEYKDQYPDMIKSFERYLKNKDNGDEVTNKIKDEILLMLYNNRLIEQPPPQTN